MSSAPLDREPVTVAVTGAGGRVAYSLMFRIANGGMFGLDQPVALRLLEKPWRLPALQAVAMELDDCAFPLLQSVEVTDDAHTAFAGASWIILLAGEPRDIPSPSRHELLRRNGAIYVEHGQAINAAAPSARILVVAAPCNANCMIAMSQARDVPREHWFAMTRLDQARATAFIAQKAQVAAGRVSRVVVWGNHGNLIYSDLHNALVDETPAHEVIRDVHWTRVTLQHHVRNRSAEIFKRCALSPAGAAAQAILGTVRSIVTPTPLNRYFTAAVASNGSYGVPKNLVFGFPLRTDDGRAWSIEEGLYLDEFAQSQIEQNVAQLEQEAVLAERWFG